MSILKRLTYLKPVILLTRRLHLHIFLRRLYFLWARPRDGILHLQISGVRGDFKPQTPEELRMLEAMYGEREILEPLMRDLRQGDIIYDIGSNVGLYAIFLAKVVGAKGQVIAFEPEQQTFEHLTENLKLNNAQNVRVFRKAVGDWNGEGKLGMGEVTGNFSLSRLYTRETSQQTVEVVRGDDFIQVESLPAPNVVKIDVEGFELSVLRGLSQNLAKASCRLICCEIHPKLLPPGVQESEVLDYLKSLGFQRIETFPRWDSYHALCYKV